MSKRQALYQKKGNNPPKIIGFLDTETRDVYTARGSHSTPERPLNLRTDLLRAGYTPTFVENQAHKRRMEAIVKGDATGEYVYYV